MENMLLYGAGGHAKVIIDCLLANEIEIAGIFVVCDAACFYLRNWVACLDIVWQILDA